MRSFFLPLLVAATLLLAAGRPAAAPPAPQQTNPAEARSALPDTLTASVEAGAETIVLDDFSTRDPRNLEGPLDFRLVEAAYDLGADKWRALVRIVVPLAMPGIAAGCILVFVPSLGAYVTPELLGGGKALMIGNLIQSQFGAARNWPLGAALAFFLLAIVLLVMMAYALRFRRSPGAA